MTDLPRASPAFVALATSERDDLVPAVVRREDGHT
jgi:hypothetical protein